MIAKGHIANLSNIISYIKINMKLKFTLNKKIFWKNNAYFKH